MTKFHNGPAHDVTLLLRRIPAARFIRAVVNPAGEWDALDMLDDTAAPSETIYAYKIKAGTEPSWCHLNMGRKSGSGMYQIAEYEFIEQQPADEDLRENPKWQAWCLAESKTS